MRTVRSGDGEKSPASIARHFFIYKGKSERTDKRRRTHRQRTIARLLEASSARTGSPQAPATPAASSALFPRDR